MRINELVGVKNITHRRPYLHQIVQFLMNRGFDSAGSGAFADVLIPPNKDYVLKLFVADDFPYLAFIKHVASSNNPHFPVLRGRPVKVTEKVLAVRMEPLEPMSWKQADRVRNYCRYHALETPPTPQDQLPDDMQQLTAKYPRLDEAVALMRSWIQPNMRWDLHGENIMKRGHTPVFTDPWAYSVTMSRANPGRGVPPRRLSS
jgi:hypothetical protein